MPSGPTIAPDMREAFLATGVAPESDLEGPIPQLSRPVPELASALAVAKTALDPQCRDGAANT
ncbi:MAG: hypothetical protein AAFR17_02345 [Pseudomonadota bacterium]